MLVLSQRLQNAAGCLNPPVSVPVATGMSLAATAAAEPPKHLKI